MSSPHKGEACLSPFLSLVEKLCEKEPHPISHCDSFDQFALQLLNDCKFIYLVFQLKF